MKILLDSRGSMADISIGVENKFKMITTVTYQLTTFSILQLTQATISSLEEPFILTVGWICSQEIGMMIIVPRTSLNKS